MSDNLRQVWRQAMDANIRLYREWGRLTERYVSDLAAAVNGLTPVVRVPVPTTATAPAPVPGLVLEGTPGAVVQSALLVQNHLDHPVTTAVRAEMGDPDAVLLVEPGTVTLAPGEDTIVRVSATIPVDPGTPARHGTLSCPELAGTTLPVVVRASAVVGRPATPG